MIFNHFSHELQHFCTSAGCQYRPSTGVQYHCCTECQYFGASQVSTGQLLAQCRCPALGFWKSVLGQYWVSTGSVLNFHLGDCVIMGWIGDSLFLFSTLRFSPPLNNLSVSNEFCILWWTGKAIRTGARALIFSSRTAVSRTIWQ